MSAPFRHRMRVRYAECDPQGVVFNSRYLEYFDVALTELWRTALGSYEEATREHGIDLVVAEATVRYRSGLRFDEQFDLVLTIPRLGETSISTAISVERLEGEPAAEGEIRHVVVRFGTTEKKPIPDRVREALEPYAVD